MKITRCRIYLLTVLLSILLVMNGSICWAGVEDLQVTQIAVQGKTLVLTVYNASSESVSARYSASAILVSGVEETAFSDGFVIAANQTLQVTIEFSDYVMSGAGDGGCPWPW